ncbi:MAG: peptidylprolyl isomerase [Candidatus Saganbacteria bacterium]|nr:peptidylprolyl isomerase [Candidatus Saganbacteria bacterium]
MPDKLYAKLQTSQGDIICLLFSDSAPLTVANFVGLANGEKEWTDPNTGEKTSRPLYNGTIFHRVIPDFMIQGGDPLGTGMGEPGYRFKDEIDPALTFSNPGMLAMANSGANSNGSQFFITVAPTTWLNGKHTIFGRVIEGQDVVESISLVKRDKQNRPLTPVVLEKVTILEELD